VDFSLVVLLDVHAHGMLHFMMRKYFDIVGRSNFFFFFFTCPHKTNDDFKSHIIFGERQEKLLTLFC
jgi:hypothetical protein